MQSKIKVICGGMLAILIAMWPPFGSPGQNTQRGADSVRQAKQIIRANVDTIRGLNTYIKEKAKEVPDVKPVVPPRVYSSWLNRLIRSKRSEANLSKKDGLKVDPVPADVGVPANIDNSKPVIIYQACQPYPGTQPRSMTEKEYRDYRGPIYKLFNKRHEK